MADPFAIGLGAIGVATSLLDDESEDETMRRQARQNGKDAASVRFAGKRYRTALTFNLAQTERNRDLAKMSINSQQAQTEADMRVQAAATGVAGDSVDTVIADTERTAALATEAIDRQKNVEAKQLQINIVDSTLEEFTGERAFEAGSSSNRALARGGRAVLGFMQGYQLGI